MFNSLLQLGWATWHEYSCGKHFEKLTCFGWNCQFVQDFKEMICIWKKKKKKKTKDTLEIKQIYWKTAAVCLFVRLSMANIPILNRTWRAKRAGKSQLSHSWAWSSGFTGFQSPDRQTTPELGREWKLCFRGNLSNKKTTYSSKMELNQISKTSHILPSKVTDLGITSSYDFRVYFWINCSWT